MLGEAKAIAVLVAVAALWFGYKAHVRELRAEGRAQCVAEYAEAAKKAEAENAARHEQQAREAAAIDKRNAEALARLRAQSDADRATVERLRRLIAAGGGQAPAPAGSASGADAVGTAERVGVLQEGLGLVAEGRALVDRLALKVAGLQAYITQVCGQ